MSRIFPIGKEPFSMPSQLIRTAADFGTMIRNARTQQGLTQRQLALSTGTGERFIVELEAGKQTLRLGKALEVAAALGIKTNMLYEA